MKPRGVLYWAPRILCLLFIAFISLFALDVFTERVSVPHLVIAFLIHLIPSAILVILLALSWDFCMWSKCEVFLERCTGGVSAL
jgi:hypothetical protein